MSKLMMLSGLAAMSAMSMNMGDFAQLHQAKAGKTAPVTPPAMPAAAAPIAPPPLPPSVANATALPYAVEAGGPPPERTRSFGGSDRTPSPLVALFTEMPLPEGDTYAQVFIPIADDAVPAGITDGNEREKVSKEASRKLVNNLGSIARRIKKNDPTFNTTMREVVENGKRGVRVWRIAPAEAPATA